MHEASTILLVVFILFPSVVDSTTLQASNVVVGLKRTGDGFFHQVLT